MKKKIFAICGSTRVNSSNLVLLKAIEKLNKEKLNFEIFEDLVKLPHFNPDETESEHPLLKSFKNKIINADAVIICTPEYAHGVPGTLKNAIDWTVGSGEFHGKPTLLITASTDGQFGHQALLETLKVIEVAHIEELNLLIQFVRSKINEDSEITDEPTKEKLNTLINKLASYL